MLYTGDDACAEAVRRAGAEPFPAAAVRRVLAQRDPALPRGQQDHLHLRHAHPQRQRLQRTGKTAIIIYKVENSSSFSEVVIDSWRKLFGLDNDENILLKSYAWVLDCELQKLRM